MVPAEMAKNSKRRDCPAAGREISSAECGQNRQSRYACPADCPHSPFAPENYDQFLELEEGLNTKAFVRLFSDEAVGKSAKKAFERGMRKGDIGEGLPIFERWLFAERIDGGASVAERWRDEGFPGLKNDEVVLFRRRLGSKMALLEVRCVLDDLRSEVVDLLDSEGEPIVVFDRSFASRACRFQTAVGWIYEAPHFVRASGGMLSLPDFEECEQIEALLEVVGHLGGATEGPELRSWLGLNFEKLKEALVATGLARRKQMFEGMDAQLGKAVYHLEAPFAECVKVLDEEACVDRADLSDADVREGILEARAWFEAPGETPNAVSGETSLGRALLGADEWRLEAMGKARLEELRERFEARMEGRVRFVSECREDLAAQMRLKDPEFDPNLVPPRLLEQPRKILFSTTRIPHSEAGNSVEEAIRRQEEAFLNESVPMLDGVSPREAARDPLLRPKLIWMMKSRILSIDEENLRTGESRDIDWMLEELGLNEIRFAPPPPRASTGECFDDDDEDDDDDLIDASYLPSAPRLPERPLTPVEIEERLNHIPEFHSVAAVESAIEASGSTVFADLDSLIGKFLNDDEWGVLMPSLTNLWFIFVPHGCRSPIWKKEDVGKIFSAELEKFAAAAKRGGFDEILAYVKQSPQPAAAMSSVLYYLESCRAFFEEAGLKNEPSPAAMAALKTVIAILDRELRDSTS
ncbi:MAG: hypothetical protein ACI9VS_000779 [Candidatus Binatia bacterium]|jgi:hypothetical protein